MMNDFNGLDDAPQDVMIRSTTPSLAISPNLDALLEHDERTRSPNRFDNALSSHLLQSPHSASFSTAFPTGLPPPPRGNRKGGSRPSTPKSSADSPGSRQSRRSDTKDSPPVPSGLITTWTEVSNPYINTPPKLVRVEGSTSEGSSRQEQTPTSNLPSPAVSELPETLRKALNGISDPPATVIQIDHAQDRFNSSRSHQSSPTVSREDCGPSQVSSQASSPLLPRTYATMPRVEKLIGKGKSMFSTSGHHQNSTTDHSDEEVDPSPISSHGRERGKVSKLTENPSTSRESAETRQTRSFSDQSQRRQRAATKDDGNTPITPPLTASSRPSSARSNKEPKKAARPSLSHASHSWEASRNRSHSYSSGSTNSPISLATSADKRISISSTIYPSSINSDTFHLPTGSTDFMSQYPSGYHHIRSQSSANPGRDSFIDLFSPSSPDFLRLPDHSPTSSLSGTPRSPLSTHTGTESGAFDHRPPLSPTSPGRSFSSPAHSILQFPKPPVPTAPKPNFKRSSSVHLPSNQNSRRLSPNPMSRFSRQAAPRTVDTTPPPVPPTTNFLNANERADLVKKSRKLAQVFGTTPGAEALSQQLDDLQPNAALHRPGLETNSSKRRHVRGAVSVSGSLQTSIDDSESLSSWQVPGGTQYVSASGRRHSAPLSPDQFSFLQHSTDDDHPIIEIGSEQGEAISDWASMRDSIRLGPDSPTSFIDLSDEEISVDTPRRSGKRSSNGYSPSTPSLMETLTSEEQEEADRKRKRDKLAKLHRFLGSRVPVELVLGLSDGDTSLPAPALRAPDGGLSKLGTVSEDDEPRRAWLTRRRSSSAAILPSRSDDLERIKEDLNDEEKAINVRRAHKMEKLFGVLPPQTLYHTRHSPSPSMPAGSTSVTPNRSYIPVDQPPSPTARGQNANQASDRNPNQSAYKAKAKKQYRPGTSESVQLLLPPLRRESLDLDSQIRKSLNPPDVYTHYQHSLHSLNDIIDRDDRTSLVELHQYLQGDAPDPPLKEFVRSPDLPSSASIKSERRRSLPSSIISVSTTDYALPSPKPEVTDFQLRRRRAAKLTQFFGVDYKQIINDVLESIEKGVDEEKRRGTLQPEEAEALLRKLRALKTKRNGIF